MKKYIFIVLAILLSGCSQTDQILSTVPTTTEITNKPRLQISVIVNEDADFTTIKAEQLGGNFEEDISYYDLIDVTINIGGKNHPLDEAIRDGLITVEEIFAYARIDARNGICTENFESNHGLTHFTYAYPAFDLRLTYDVYETPDGKTHLINDFGIYRSGANISSFYPDDETGLLIDREDWGLTFEAASATAYNVTLNYTQSGGQHIGDIIVEYYSLFTASDYKFVTRLDGIHTVDQYQSIPLLQNTSSQITINWTDTHGAIPSGEYILRIHLLDIFDESTVHPLMDDFSNKLYYDVPFSIP